MIIFEKTKKQKKKKQQQQQKQPNNKPSILNKQHNFNLTFKTYFTSTKIQSNLKSKRYTNFSQKATYLDQKGLFF